MNSLDELKELIAKAKQEISKVIVGQDKVIDLSIITILSHSHALLEGVPGVGKTLLVRTLGKVFNTEFGRIQFTPDLMPSDITGTNIFNFQENNFSLQKGPVFTSFLLADEINRAPAKTQAALLQSMQEREVCIDGANYPLPYNFTVFATQNPIEYEGTYSLPEAQKDRFLLKLFVDYPEYDEEKKLITDLINGDPADQRLDDERVETIFTLELLQECHSTINSVLIKEELIDYILKIVRLTRDYEAFLIGAGPRASQSLILAARAYALLQGRDFVIPDDIKYMAEPVLAHRIIIKPEYEMEGLEDKEVINTILEEVAVPR
jgi:MoxR-like ATPase